MCAYSKCNVALMADRSWRQEVTSFPCVVFFGNTMQCFLKKECINMIRIYLSLWFILYNIGMICVNPDYKSIWNLNASTCKCNQMCTVCPGRRYSLCNTVRTKKKHDQGISSTVQFCTILAFGFQWFWYDSVDEIAEMRTDLNVKFLLPPCSSRENFKILDTTWPPAPRIVWWKIVSSGFRSFHVRLRRSHVWPGGNSYGIFAPVDSRLIGGKNFLLPSPILLSHSLHEGLLFQT